MKTPQKPNGNGSGGLEGRWEEVLRGKASPEETDLMRREIASTGRKDVFETQAEMSDLVEQFAIRHKAPSRLRQFFLDLAKEEVRRKRKQKWLVWRGALTGAVAASLVIAVTWMTLNPTVPIEPIDPFDIVAEEARAVYHRAMIEVQSTTTKKVPLESLLASFKTHLSYEPEVSFRDNTEFDLEGGGIEDISGQRVPTFRFRSGGRALLLVVLPLKDDAPLALIPENEWEINTKGSSPPTSIWRRGKSIYALVGYTSPEHMKKFSSVLTP
jgi:hypothetical protein